jgi:glycogen operon protein
VLARELWEVNKLSAFFDIIQQDPILANVKLIAEPWDLGPGGYQVGNFPVGWAEWNGRYRDAVRRFWKGEGGVASELATRFCGSSDLYEHDGRRPHASINFVTCHDGFTLHDLVSYESKHNEANGEENRDGESNNASCNCGAEGPTQDPAIIALREKQKRNLLATLLLSQGVPMLLMGDELGRTQNGNNNAYCQDNELSWMRWERTPEREALGDFLRKLLAIRKDHRVFRRRRFFQGRRIRGEGVKDLTWFEPGGIEMGDVAWDSPHTRSFAVRMSGHQIEEVDERGELLVDDDFFSIINAHAEGVTFRLPDSPGARWELVLDTARPEPVPAAVVVPGGGSWEADARSFALFKLIPEPGDASRI